MDISVLQQFEKSISQAVNWLDFHLNDEGALELTQHDLSSYAAVPYLFSLIGRLEPANRNLHYIEKEFLQSPGELASVIAAQGNQFGVKDELTETIGWVAFAAQIMGRFEISVPLFQYLRQFYVPEQGAFTARSPTGHADALMDFGSTAFLGWISLHCGDLVKAGRAGNYLQRCVSLQPDIRAMFYMRMDDAGRLMTSFDNDESAYYVIVKQRSQQRYANLGFAVGLLAKLYAATGETSYLISAKACQECVQSLSEGCVDIHTAWGAAVLARLTQEKRYVKQAQDQASAVLALQQSDGSWAACNATFAETARHAIWLSHMIAELSGV